MSKFKTALTLLFTKPREILKMVFYNTKDAKFWQKISDQRYVSLVYYMHFGKWPNLRTPILFNEKLQWLKFNDQKEEYSVMVDKIAVKEYVRKRIGDQYIIPTLGVWDRPEDIDFDSLPKQFVLKWNHDSGSIVLCKDKDQLDKAAALKKLQHGYLQNGFWYGREYPYKNVIPKVFAEAYMEDTSTKELRDYKIFTFNGEVKLLLIASDRLNKQEPTKFDYYDCDGNHLDIINDHPNAYFPPAMPQRWEEMKKLAEMLATGTKHLRVDFYEVNGQIFFGELTFFHGSGFMHFYPERWNTIMGDWIRI